MSVRILEFDRRTVIFGDPGTGCGSRRFDWRLNEAGEVELTDFMTGRKVVEPQLERIVARKVRNEPMWLQRP